jgi:hypothetical protein
MPRDLRIARPFSICGSDNKVYQLGVAYYPQMSDDFCANWHVQHNTQSQVLARGLDLVQYRWLGGVVPPTNGGNGPMLIWIGTMYSPAVYGTEIEPGWKPAFFENFDFFPPLDLPATPDFVPFGIDAQGKTFYMPHNSYDRVLRRNRRKTSGPPAIKVFPGDPSPPVSPDAAPPLRDGPGQQANDPSTMTAYPQLYPPSEPNDPMMMPWPQSKFTGMQRTPTPPAWPQEQYFDRDPRF